MTAILLVISVVLPLMDLADPWSAEIGEWLHDLVFGKK